MNILDIAMINDLVLSRHSSSGLKIPKFDSLDAMQSIVYKPEDLYRCMSCSAGKLTSTVRQFVCQLNINKHLPRRDRKRKRGKRAGRFRGCGSRFRKQKSGLWDSNKGIHLNNIRNIQPSDTDYSASNNNMCLGTVNTHSVRNKINTFLHHVYLSQYDVCTVTETWLKGPEDDTVRAQLSKAGYKFLDSPRLHREGGGTGIIFKQHLDITPLDFGIKSSFEFSEWRLDSKTFSTTFIVIYRPPYSRENRVTVSSFLEEFSDYLSHILPQCVSVVISGDFNIHINDITDPNTVAFKELFDNFCLIQHVQCPTHYLGNTLDLFITSSTDSAQFSEPIATCYISDHSFITCYISKPKPKCVKSLAKFRKIKEINHEQFNNDLAALVMKSTDIQDTEELVNLYNQGLLDILDQHAPVIEKRVTQRQSLPWFDDEANELKRCKRRAEKKWLKSRSPEDKVTYKEVSATYQHYLKHNKHVFINNAVRDCGKDTGKLFKLVSELTGRVKENPLPTSDTDKELADDFVDFFMVKIDKIRKELEQYPLYHPGRKDMVIQFNTFNPVTEQVVFKIVSSSKATTCPSDPIPTKLVKQHLETLILFITRIVNSSLQSGQFVSSWKKAVIRPLLKKKGLDCIMKNYRPVSTLPFLSKIVEKCCLEQFMHFIESNRLLPTYQSAYRKGYSTESALLKLCNDILWGMESQCITPLVAIDLSAAFDTVNHSVLLDVLHNNFAVSDTPLEWFSSYLRPRSAVVQIRDTQSKPMELDFSVPQGSISGPVLYTAYASTLEHYIEQYNISIMGYADDHSLYDCFSANDREAEHASIEKLKYCLVDVNDWMNYNRLKMNSDKTEFILFGNKIQLEKCTSESIQVVDSVVSCSHVIKYLGVYLDQNLTFEKHISDKCKSAALNLHHIRTIRSYLSKDSTQQLVYSLVISLLDYANSLFIGLPVKTLKRLQRVQNMAAKLILNYRKYDSATDALYKLHWLPVIYRRDFKVACLVHKSLYGNGPAYLQELLVPRVSHYRTRSVHDNCITLQEPYNSCKTFADRSFAFGGPRVWNSLPPNIRSIVDFDHFKSDLKTFMFKKAF